MNVVLQRRRASRVTGVPRGAARSQPPTIIYTKQNTVGKPHVGLLFLVPGREETLRVNGRACITRDAGLLERCVVQGKLPQLAIGVEVEECFVHCVKAFRRAGLWVPDTWPAPEVLPSMAHVLFEQIKPDGVTMEQYEHDVEEACRKLY